MPPRGRKAALAAVPEEAELASSPVGVEGIATPPLPSELLRDYSEIETELEARIAEIQAAAEDSILALRNECRRQLVKLPKSVRSMTLARLKEELPDDYSAAGLKQIQEKLASLAAPVLAPSTRSRATTARKRAAPEPQTVLRTVQTRRMAARTVAPTQEDAAQDNEGAAASEAAGPPRPPLPPKAVRGGASKGSSKPPNSTSFNGVPLATPLPFAGPAMELPVTFVTEQKKARFTRAAAPPSAVVLRAPNGAAYAVSKAEDLQDLPGQDAEALVDMLRSQREFLDKLLAKTVTTRRGGGRVKQ